MPDAELLARAAAGELHRPEVLAAQARACSRMIARAVSPRSSAAIGSIFAASKSTTAWIASASRRSTTSCGRRCSRSQSVFSSTSMRENRSVLDFLYAEHTFVNAAARQALRHARAVGRTTSGAGVDECRPLRSRRAAAHGGLPDQELARPADQPGQTRLLGCAPGARRTHPTAAGCGARICPTTKRNWASSLCARRWPGIGRTRTAPAVTSASILSGWSSRAMARSASGATRISAARPVDTRAAFPGGSEGTGLEGLRHYLREHRQEDFVDNLCRKLLAYGLGRTLIPSRRSTDRRNARQAAARTVTGLAPWWKASSPVRSS